MVLFITYLLPKPPPMVFDWFVEDDEDLLEGAKKAREKEDLGDFEELQHSLKKSNF